MNVHRVGLCGVGWILTWLLVLVLAQSAEPEHRLSAPVVLETFETYPPQTFPKHWTIRGEADTARAIYSVAEEAGNRFLHAHSEKHGIQVGLS